LILLLSVDWLPPSVRPSGAGLVLGTRVCCSLFTPSRVAPPRGCASADAQSKWRENGCWTCNGLGLWDQRDLLGHGPHTRTQCPRDGDDDVVRVFSAGTPLPRAFTESYLGLPTEILDGLRDLLQTAWEMPPAGGGGARGPGACAPGAAGMAMTSLGEAALTAPGAGGVCRRRQARITHQLSGVGETGEIAAGGHGRHGACQLDAAQGLQGVAHRPKPPGLHLGCACRLSALPPCGVLGHRAAVCWKDDLLCWRGTDDRAAPPERGRAPGRPACVPDILP
jgi:hypothetical protein